MIRFLLVMLLVCLWTPASASTPRQSFDLQVPWAPMAVMVDGHRQLVYELHVTNYAGVSLLPSALDVLDADATEKPLASWAGPALVARMAIAGTDKSPGAEGLAAGMQAVIYVEVVLPADARVPRRLIHRLAYRTISHEGEPGEVTGGAFAVDRRAPVSLAPPLRGGPWVAIYDASVPRGHRRVMFALDGRARIPARFAIDWFKLDRRGHHARSNAQVARNWLGYGEDVLAVADATVVATRNDYPESKTLKNPRHPLGEGSGNFVSLALGGGRYAHYEHLQPGSIRVHVGEHVRRGEVIGALGFSGDSTGPHLHFHVSDGAAPLAGEGLPFVIASYETLGDYPDLDDFDAGKTWRALPAQTEHGRDGEMPAPGAVVDFPES
ncbi:M23 family metallopeptidase [Rhodanobacter glycinis]|uniref:Peptidase family M23 n=1 Tax=Rhodanobacter glycinis TaxID=582702 RepID=A0A1I4E878_9GAMM|nr:M23 family metallopeptidase [Rhodanobacter glycinis]SFL01130.1 Peptidase family M23 [Rhodanobacter glycinis]